MGRYEQSIKSSLSRRKSEGMTAEEAFHDLKTNLYFAERVWHKEVEEIERVASFEQRSLTDEEIDEIERKKTAWRRDTQKRLEVEELERSGWKP